ncbi:sensor histidine kinase [Bacillus sp. BRMEA1]|uniref:sensor histidine kinase n=1 Tax=Neobacillus endophyticus TaxID=2738405 RepID=UPI0015653ACB|nr:sensor histidine kinase [Neobacillus endophyticus]NRD76855.1 sensor histidine kinase [Neobacillus endophyticus]
MKRQNTIKIMVIFRLILILTASFDIMMRPYFSLPVKAVCIAGVIILHVNDYIRNYFQLFERNRIIYYISMAVGIIGSGLYLLPFDNIALNLYFIFPIVEIFLYRPTIQVGLLILHILVFLFDMVVLKEGIEKGLFPYVALLAMVYLFRINSREKEKGNLLNVELMEANAKLKEITIVKERTRIAQELHDSLGHGLIALKMHLEFAENMLNTHPEKAKEVMKKALGISQTSIADLRKAVAVLKDDQAWKNNVKLRDSLTDLIDSLQTAGRLQFEWFCDDMAEYASRDIQSAVYETVREAITNGIKHGNARTFHIDIFVHDKKLLVKVEDDGAGCSDMKKSHGLRGMEERIQLWNGTIHFVSVQGRGFAVEAEIPFVTNVE